MLPKHSLFIDLLQMKRIQSVSQLQVELRYQQEMNSLSRLCQQKSSYLNRYDQLFRYITLWLLQHGYDLTDYQPHQTLKAVCLSHFPNWDIGEVVRQRHLLKKGLKLNPESDVDQELQHCVNTFQALLQAYEF